MSLLSARSGPGSGARRAFCWSQFPDARAEFVVAVEEVEADPGRAGHGPEVDLLLVLDERGSRSRPGHGSLSFGQRGLPQRAGPAIVGGSGHGVPGLGVMVTFAGPASW